MYRSVEKYWQTTREPFKHEGGQISDVTWLSCVSVLLDLHLTALFDSYNNKVLKFEIIISY